MGDRAVKRGSTVILANGSFPRRGGEAWKLLSEAVRIVACDGAADSCFRRLGRKPDVAVGDLDSLKSGDSALEVVKVADQQSNDLDKAICLCASRGWRNPVVVGACGKREDHTIGNVFLALDRALEVVSDHGRFLPVRGKLTMELPVGTAVSVFTCSPSAKMHSTGLKWPLDGVVFSGLYRATLNRTCRRMVSIVSDCPACVYVAFPCGARRGSR